MIVARGVRKSFTGPDEAWIRILRDVEVELAPGDTLAVMGPSGSGKSTLLNILGMLEQPDAGYVEIDGTRTTGLPDKAASDLRGRRIGFVFQQFYLLPRRSALDNVTAPLLHAGRRELRQRDERGRELLEAVGLGHRMDFAPERLSGGEQQRVAIARALARRPRYVLADEPTGALDRGTGAAVLETLTAAVRDEGCGLMLVTHDPAVAAAADRVLALRGGTLVAQEGDGP